MRLLLAILLLSTACAANPPPRAPGSGGSTPASSTPPDGGAGTAAAPGTPGRLPASDLPATSYVEKQPPLPRTVQGLLITRPSRWGRLLELGNPSTSPGGYGTYWFVADGLAWAVYFTSKGEGVNFIDDWQVAVPGGKELFDAAMYEPGTADPWGLDDEAHLVSVEVNGGRGAPYWPHFVITSLQLLDGTVDASAALDEARTRWLQLLVDETDAIAAELALAAKQPVGPPLPGSETERVDEAFYPSWDEQAVVLRVRWVRRIVRTTQRTDPAPPCNRGKSKKACRGPIEIRHGHGVEVGLDVQFGAGGAVVATTVYGPTAMSAATLTSGGYVTVP